MSEPWQRALQHCPTPNADTGLEYLVVFVYGYKTEKLEEKKKEKEVRSSSLGSRLQQTVQRSPLFLVFDTHFLLTVLVITSQTNGSLRDGHFPQVCWRPASLDSGWRPAVRVRRKACFF